MKLLIEFLREKHEQRNAEDIEAKELNEYLCEFILIVKRKDGKDFEPSSLRDLFSSFNRHLKECKYPVSVIKDVAFERARKCLEAKNKQQGHPTTIFGKYLFGRQFIYRLKLKYV